ncbi:MAG: ATPase domain-containing protein [Balneolaceae bacterium]|nr:ATPase domain-containing protein [Balneolaceae bacterium]
MSTDARVPTGLAGLDEILKGGFLPNNAYLVRGGPGTGKSTFGMHFLSHGARLGEKALYITLGESEKNLRRNAGRMDIDLEGVYFVDESPRQDLEEESGSYGIFHSGDVEQQPILESVVEKVRELEPNRVFLDSITMLRFLSRDPFQLRKTALSLMNYIGDRGGTLLMTSETADDKSEQDATFWVDGNLHLEYSPDWRKLRVTKFRGSDFMHGTHAFRISEQGITIFPRLQPRNYERKFVSEALSSGIPELDNLLHGGLEKGTITIVTGPTGTGKTNMGVQFLKEAASRGERSALYTFEESAETVIRRSESINVPIRHMIEKGNLRIVPVGPLTYSPDEFLNMVRTDVEENGTTMVMIDSIGAYSLAVREENTLERLHTLTVYLQNMGITGLLLHEASNITGQFETTGMNASYLADNIIFLRYMEMEGELRKVVGVLKKRMSDFERSIRHFEITSEGLQVGGRLDNLRGILTGLPEQMQS